MRTARPFIALLARTATASAPCLTAALPVAAAAGDPSERKVVVLTRQGPAGHLSETLLSGLPMTPDCGGCDELI